MKRYFEYTQKEFIELLGHKYSSVDLAWLVDEGRITEEQFDEFNEAVKIPVEHIVKDVEYVIKNKMPIGAEVHKGVIRKAILDGHIVPENVLLDYPDLKPPIAKWDDPGDTDILADIEAARLVIETTVIVRQPSPIPHRKVITAFKLCKNKAEIKKVRCFFKEFKVLWVL